jgi:hypothetical protein
MTMKNLMLLTLVLGGLQYGGIAAAKCTNATLQGTVVAAISKTTAGAPGSTMYMESWDGAGHLQYLETDSDGTTTFAPYYGTGTYTIAADCVATVYYDGDTTRLWTYYINENGTGYSWINTLNIGVVAAGQTQLISSELLVSSTATTGPCSTATLKGTLAFAVEKTTAGVPQASAGMESYDGAGNLHYEQTDSGGYSTTSYKGTGTYTITSGCVASVYYDGSATPFVYFVAPNGSAFWWINNQNTGTVAAGKETRVATALIVK